MDPETAVTMHLWSCIFCSVLALQLLWLFLITVFIHVITATGFMNSVNQLDCRSSRSKVPEKLTWCLHCIIPATVANFHFVFLRSLQLSWPLFSVLVACIQILLSMYVTCPLASKVAWYTLGLASFPSLSHSYLPFAFTMIHGSIHHVSGRNVDVGRRSQFSIWLY